jgi:(p)ppGpp synthase/HD superfamily hydrolase
MKRGPLLSHRFDEALACAAELHRSQGRKGTRVPYVSHVLGVASIALEHGATEDEAIAALLHDAIEDAPPELGPEWVRLWIRAKFGRNVLHIVEECTDADIQPWRRRKEAYVRHLAHVSVPVLLVSASDKLHNARAILRDFNLSGERIWKRFKSRRKKDVVGYYKGLVTAFASRRKHRTLVLELSAVVAEIERRTRVKGQWPLPARKR